jgi:NitT/TauT family transport system substrate-binding protein
MGCRRPGSVPDGNVRCDAPQRRAVTHFITGTPSVHVVDQVACLPHHGAVSRASRNGTEKGDVSIRAWAGGDNFGDVERRVNGLWAPNTYTMEEKEAKQICSTGRRRGRSGRADRARRLCERASRDVAAFLAVYLRAWKWLNAHQPEAIAMMKKFYEQGGVTISETSMKKEFTTRPTYDLAGQLRIMNRPAGGASEVDGWFTKIGGFMKANGTFLEAPAAGKFVTDEYLKMVDADPKLKAFANRAD